jgi:hypothetical protein
MARLLFVSSLLFTPILSHVDPPPSSIASDTSPMITITPSLNNPNNEPFRPFTPRAKDDLNSGLCPFLSSVSWSPPKPLAVISNASLLTQVVDKVERCWNYSPPGSAFHVGIYNWFTSHWDSNKCYTCYCYVGEDCVGEVSQKLEKWSPLYEGIRGWKLPPSGPCGSISCPIMRGCKAKGCPVEEELLEDF